MFMANVTEDEMTKSCLLVRRVNVHNCKSL